MMSKRRSGTASPPAPRRSAYPAAASRAPLSTEDTVEEAGTVKWFNAQKGFGFIVRDDGGKDAFIHASVLERSGVATLNEGQRVTYEVAMERGKASATNLRVA